MCVSVSRRAGTISAPARADGTFDTIGDTGTILGMLDRPFLTDVSTMLQAGDIIVLYTDGVTEGRRDREFFDEERLVDSISDAAGADAQETADRIVAAALDFQRGEAKDGIAVVVIKPA